MIFGSLSKPMFRLRSIKVLDGLLYAECQSNSTACAKSIFATTAKSALLNIGYVRLGTLGVF